MGGSASVAIRVRRRTPSAHFGSALGTPAKPNTDSGNVPEHHRSVKITSFIDVPTEMTRRANIVKPTSGCGHRRELRAGTRNVSRDQEPSGRAAPRIFLGPKKQSYWAFRSGLVFTYPLQSANSSAAWVWCPTRFRESLGGPPSITASTSGPIPHRSARRTVSDRPDP